MVLITTQKRGAAGKASFSFDTYIGLQQAIRLPDLLNSRDYLTIRNEAITNANALRDPIRQIKTYDTNILDTLPDTDCSAKYSGLHRSGIIHCPDQEVEKTIIFIYRVNIRHKMEYSKVRNSISIN